MSRVRSTKNAKALKGGGVVIKTTGKSIKQLQCPRCHQIAVPFQAGLSKTQYKCPRGHVFSGGRSM